MGRFTDALRQFIEDGLRASSWTSANPLRTNYVKALDFNPVEFEGLIEPEKQFKTNPKLKAMDETVTRYKEGNVEKINNFTTTQFANVKSMAMNPIGFLLQLFTRQLAKIAIGIGIGLLILEIVKFVVTEFLKPGRLFDRRFKRLAQEEVMLFWNHQEQQKLRQGFKDIRVTTHAGLRGGLSMVNGNLFAHQAGAGSIGPPTEYRYSTATVQKTYTSSFATDENGNPKGGHRTGGGPGA